MIRIDVPRPPGIDFLGISPDRDLELSFYTGEILLEIDEEYGGLVSPLYLIKAVRAYPHRKSEEERAYVLAYLAVQLGEGTAYEARLNRARKIRAKEKDLPLEERRERWMKTARRMFCREGILMAAVALCSVDRDQDPLIEVPLQQVQVPFLLDPEGEKTVVLITPDDIDRAREALEKFGKFQAGVA